MDSKNILLSKTFLAMLTPVIVALAGYLQGTVTADALAGASTMAVIGIVMRLVSSSAVHLPGRGPSTSTEPKVDSDV